MDIKLNNEILKAIDILEVHGYLAYVVGGYVRDSLLNIKPSEVDIATDATLDEVRFLFSNYKIVDYKKNSLVLGVIINNIYIEIATFDGKNIDEDLLNKDFTINAIAYSPSKGIYDPLNGIKDLENKIIRTTKDAIVSISVNPFRIIKAISLSFNKKFTIDKELHDVLKSRADLLKSVNPTRFKKFLDAVLMYKKPSMIIDTYYEVFFAIIPELKACYKFDQHSKYHHLDVLSHILAVVDFTSPNLILRYAALFHDIEKPKCFSLDENGEGHFYNHYIDSAETAKDLLTKMNYSKDFINKVYKLILFHDRRLEPRDVVLKRFIADFGTEDIDLLLELKKCDCLAQNPTMYNRIDELESIKAKIKEILPNFE